MTRKLKFGAVGVSSLIVSFASLLLMIDVLGVHPAIAYAIQTVLALETNFLGNALYTWGDRATTPLRHRWLRYHATRIGLMVPVNQVLFFLLHPHLGTLAANTVCIAGATVANWFLNDRMIFRASSPAVAPQATSKESI